MKSVCPLIKQRKLPDGVLYQWRYPYLIIPMDCSVDKLRTILELFDRRVAA